MDFPIPNGDIAYISENELYLNNTGADVTLPAGDRDNIIFGKFEEGNLDIAAVLDDATNNVDNADPTTHVAVTAGNVVRVNYTTGTVETIYYRFNGGTPVTIDQPVATFFSGRTAPADWSIVAQTPELCFLRIGGDQIETRAVIDASGASSTTGVFIPGGSVAWFDATNQFWNDSDQGLIINSTDTSSTGPYETNALWKRIGDGNTDTDREHTETRTIDTTAAAQTVTITPAQHGLSANPATTAPNLVVQCYEDIGKW